MNTATFTATFNFRADSTFKVQDRLARLGIALEEVKEQFEETSLEREGKELPALKRKSFSADLPLPEVAEGITDNLLLQLVKDAISDFVKVEFVDNFREIALDQVTWSNVAASRERQRAATEVVSFSEEQLAEVATNCKAVFASLGKAKAGEVLATLVLDSFSWKSIKSAFGVKGQVDKAKVESVPRALAVWQDKIKADPELTAAFALDLRVITYGLTKVAGHISQYYPANELLDF